jgi:hypothetical protein
MCAGLDKGDAVNYSAPIVKVYGALGTGINFLIARWNPIDNVVG